MAHELLGEYLARFELGRRARRAEDLQPVLLEAVDDAERQRLFGADDGQVDLFLLHETHEPLELVRFDVDVDAFDRGAGVPRRAIDALGARRLRQFPDQSVFAAAFADDEDLHARALPCSGEIIVLPRPPGTDTLPIGRGGNHPSRRPLIISQQNLLAKALSNVIIANNRQENDHPRLSPMFTSAGLIESLREHRLLDSPQLDEAKQLASGVAEPRQLASELTRRGLLTAFQVRMLSQGRGEQLIVGPYVILEKLGEGGMGAVYKARNVRLGRVVAIKLLRKERNTNVEVIRRFRREVEVVSSLAHPNVVRAFDACEVDGNLVFEMEYVEGVNLTQLVHKRGGLPVPMACDFIRQAALGLQHAHEKGLVHRDIKPSNLVVTRAQAGSPLGAEGRGARSVEPGPYGLIKLLDMGLALILTPDGGQDKTRLTQLGKVVGTTDFLAPEQARNSHGVDIRADLYALGCTFYYLLAGKVPFPDGAAMEKLLKHQLDEPEPVEKVRPEVPPALAAVVRKLMAKKAQDRYQTPAEVAAALEPFTQPSVQTTPLPPALPTLPPKAPVTQKVPTLPAARMPSAAMMPAVAAGKPASGLIVPDTVPNAVALLEPPTLPASTSVARPEPAAAVHTAPDSDPFLNMCGKAFTRMAAADRVGGREPSRPRHLGRPAQQRSAAFE